MTDIREKMILLLLLLLVLTYSYKKLSMLIALFSVIFPFFVSIDLYTVVGHGVLCLEYYYGEAIVQFTIQ